MMRFIIILLLLTSIAEAKPLKVENSQGKLILCGDLQKTERAWVIRDCPILGDIIGSGVIPAPTPEPSPSPTVAPPTPSPTVEPLVCDYRFVSATKGMQLVNKVYEPNVEFTLCADLRNLPTDFPFFEVYSVNHSNTSCNQFYLKSISPSGKEIETIGPAPVVRPDSERGNWYFKLKLLPEGLCGTNKPLSIYIAY